MAKQEGQAIVASLDSQYLHCGESDEIAAPQFGQLRVCASIDIGQLSTAKPEIATKNCRLCDEVSTACVSGRIHLAPAPTRSRGWY